MYSVDVNLKQIMAILPFDFSVVYFETGGNLASATESVKVSVQKI